MKGVEAWAVEEQGGPFCRFAYDLEEVGPFDVRVEVHHCGVCHSDLSMVDNAWGITQYPFVPGHEVVGVVVDKGSWVKNVRLGDRVGLGWHSRYCMECESCWSGHHNLCQNGEQTIVGRHGGFGSHVQAHASAVIPLPKKVAIRELGPLFCAGITVFHPLLHYHISPLSRVAVVGIGGLGHLALQFARAWGCHVTAITSSDSKHDEARAFGAHEVLRSEDLCQAQGAFDLILSTINVPTDWSSYLEALRPNGRLHLLGVVTEPISFEMSKLLFLEREISSSPVGSRAEIEKMIMFALRHGIVPKNTHFMMHDVERAMQHLRDGHARYRVVLDRG